MALEGWELVGKIKDAHGLRGDLYVVIFAGDPADFLELEEGAWGSLPPRERPELAAAKKSSRIEKIKPFKDGVIVKFADCADRTAAEALRGQGFYAPVVEGGDEVFEDEESMDLEQLRGCKLLDAEDVELGEIVDFSSNGIQDLLVVRFSRGLAEIPFVEDFLIEIDLEKRVVRMDLPEGLFDLAGAE